MEALSSTLSNSKIEVDAAEIDEEDVYFSMDFHNTRAEPNKVNSMDYDTPVEYNTQPSQVILS